MNEPTISYASPAAEPSCQSYGREIFGVIVRTLGLLLALWGVYSCAYALVELSDVMPRARPANVLFLFGAIYLAIGVALLRGGWIVRFAYGQIK